jgi:hypothetical protein
MYSKSLNSAATIAQPTSAREITGNYDKSINRAVTTNAGRQDSHRSNSETNNRRYSISYCMYIHVKKIIFDSP